MSAEPPTPPPTDASGREINPARFESPDQPPPTPERLPAPPEHPAAGAAPHRRYGFSRVAVIVLSIVIIVLGVLGTLGYSQLRGQRNTNSLSNLSTVVANQQTEIGTLKSILAYQTGSAATKASQQVSVFTLQLLTNICTALGKRPAPTSGPPLPSCVVPPLPPLLQQLLAGKLPTGETPGSSTTTVPRRS